MVAFAQPLFWQIRYLITGLSKKNYKPTVSELHQLIALYGYDAQVFFFRTLIEEIQYQEAKHGSNSGNRDQLKMQLLQNELRDIETEELFGILLYQSLEATRDGGVVQEELMLQLCRLGKLQLRPQLCLGSASLHAVNEASRREGAKFMRTKLREYLSPSGRTMRLSESLLHALLAALRGHELEEVLEEKERESLAKQLVDLHPEIDGTKGPVLGLMQVQRMNTSRLGRLEKRHIISDLSLLDRSSSSGDGTLEGVRACDLIEELGCGASSSTQAVKDVISLYPNLGTHSLAEIVCVAVRSCTKVTDSVAALTAGIFTARVNNNWEDLAMVSNEQEAAEGNSDQEREVVAIINALKESVPDAQWAEVFSAIFDLSDLKMGNDNRIFKAILAAHRAARGDAEPFPVAALLRLRKNTTAQLQFLRHTLSLTGDAARSLDFGKCPPLLQPVTGLPGAEDKEKAGGPGHRWACLALIEVLLELAEAEDYGTVRALFDTPAATTPHALLLATCLAEDRSKGALRAELLQRLAPPLFEPNAGPYALLFFSALSERSRRQLKRLIRSMQEKKPEVNLQKVLNLLQKAQLVSFQNTLMASVPSELSCRLAVLSSSNGSLKLSDWLSQILAEHKDAAAFPLIRFLRERLQPTVPSPPVLPGWADEIGICRGWLTALNAASLSPEALRQVRELAQLAHQKFPSLAPPSAPPSTPVPVPPVPVTPMPVAPALTPAPSPALTPIATTMSPAVMAALSATPTSAVPLSPEELEESSNGYFKEIYTGSMSVPDLIIIMQHFAAQPRGSWKNEVYNRMIQNLFDECKFFPKYPPQELTITGELFGALINHDLVNASNLGLALRCVLEALRRPMHTKMFRFGILALEQFLERLPAWPQLCHHITQVEHLSEAYPSYVNYAQGIWKALPEDLRRSTSLKPEALQGITLPRPPARAGPPPGTTPSAPPPDAPPQSHGPHLTRPAGAPPAGPPPPPTGAPEGAPPPPPPTVLGAATSPPPKAAPPAPPAPPPPAPPLSGAVASHLATAAAAATAGGGQGALMFSGPNTVDTLLNDPELEIDKPPAYVCDIVAAVFNSLVKDNLEQKADEMRKALQPEFYPWLCYYFVKSRASKEVNFHATYIEFFEMLRQPRLLDMVTNMTYDCVRVLLKSVDQAVVSTSHRTVLKNLGFWLGQITLGRNKPLKSKQLDLKPLLMEAFDHGRLTAVLPLVCKVLEGVSRSKVFKLPNPWTSAVMSLLAEIHDVPNLRTNLMFEVEVLCKHLDIKLTDLKRSDLLVGRRPLQGSNDLSSIRQPDARETPTTREAASATTGTLRGDAAAWTGDAAARGETETRSVEMKATTPAAVGAVGTGSYPQQGFADMPHMAGVGTDRGVQGAEDFIIPNLPSLVQVMVNPNLPFFRQQPSLKTLVPHAVDRAIKEVISAVVERSVTISCLATREMVTKDFAMEPDENVLKKAAQLMVSSVAGSLALVTCREPLRVSLTTHLWQLFLQNVAAKDMNETAMLEQLVHYLSNENLELGCQLIEKAVVDRALKDIEESIAPAIRARYEHRLRNPTIPYFDSSYIQPSSKWPQALPEMLRLKPGPLSAQQLKVYRDFNSMPFGSSKSRLPSGLPPLNVGSGVTASTTAALATLQEVSYPNQPQVPGPAATGASTSPATKEPAALASTPQVQQAGLQASKPVVPQTGLVASTTPAQAQQPQTVGAVVTAGPVKSEAAAFLDGPRETPTSQQNAELAQKLDDGRTASRQGTDDRSLASVTIDDEEIIDMFEEWHAACQANPDGLEQISGSGGQSSAAAAWQRITSAGFMKAEATIERFFQICCNRAVHHALTDDSADQKDSAEARATGSLNDGQETLPDSVDSTNGVEGAGLDFEPPVALNFAAVDNFTRLVVLLMKLDDKVQTLTRALNSITRSLIADCEKKGLDFNQRPFFRILLNLLMDVIAPDATFEQNNFRLLSAFCSAFQACNPMVAPNFAFAWLELISNRMFMPKLLMVPSQRGWLNFQRLLVQLLYFLEPYLRRVQLNESSRLLYRGTVRMLLVLLHDFPEFLCDYHFSFCDIIPVPCIQIRNLILSAFPRNMKLPDPFLPNLKVDLLPEINVAPRILANYTATLEQQQLKVNVDNFMTSRDQALLGTILGKLLLPRAEAVDLGTKYNVPLLNALLLYVGVDFPQHGKAMPGQAAVGSQSQGKNPSLDIFMYLAHNFDYEGRYLFLSAIANHLRYPNTHTHYFSCLLLYLFAETTNEVVREQITRVLLERLIVHRPHPWGLLITFIELIKNRRYEFWNHAFVKCAPEVEKLFQSVAYTCLGTTITEVAGSES